MNAEQIEWVALFLDLRKIQNYLAKSRGQFEPASCRNEARYNCAVLHRTVTKPLGCVYAFHRYQIDVDQISLDLDNSLHHVEWHS